MFKLYFRGFSRIYVWYMMVLVYYNMRQFSVQQNRLIFATMYIIEVALNKLVFSLYARCGHSIIQNMYMTILQTSMYILCLFGWLDQIFRFQLVHVRLNRNAI